MKNDNFEANFADWKKRADVLDRNLLPFANRPVDVSIPDWQETLAQRPHPADASKLRPHIETLFGEIIEGFETYNSDQRQQIIDMMARYDALMWSAVIDADTDTSDGFRKHMILFVLADQGKDTRDAMLALAAHHVNAKIQGIDVDTIFRDMAYIASTRDKYGWGSTRDLFLKYVE